MGHQASILTGISWRSLLILDPKQTKNSIQYGRYAWSANHWIALSGGIKFLRWIWGDPSPGKVGLFIESLRNWFSVPLINQGMLFKYFLRNNILIHIHIHPRMIKIPRLTYMPDLVWFILDGVLTGSGWSSYRYTGLRYASVLSWNNTCVRI